MKNIYILILILLTSISSKLSAQSYYYYYQGQKKYLTIDKSGFEIKTNLLFQSTSISQSNIEPVALEASGTAEKNGSIEFINNPTDIEYFAKNNEIKTNENVIAVSPRYLTEEGNILYLSGYLFVKLKTTADFGTLQTLAASKHFSILGPNQFMPLWYKIKCDKNTLGNALDISNYLYETGHFSATDPGFSSKTLQEEAPTPQSLVGNTNTPQTHATPCTNDSNFVDLWGLQNTTNPGIDINVCNAWTITEGAGVKVAVVDTGIDLNNIDVSSNILPMSYDTHNYSSPSQNYYPYHGTQVSGVIGSIKNNNYQVVGVAPQSKLFSISSRLNNNSDLDIEQRADGINWAWQNGADIINNSWFCDYTSNFIDNAISNALLLGRNGLGTIIVFLSGNSPKPLNPNSYSIPYPANSNDKLIVVGAIDNIGNRAPFISCYGEKLDVVAPGVDILTTSNNNSLVKISGTSFAAPHVSGIAALMLSVNPHLSVKQVSDIIEKTAKKLNNYSYANTSNRPNGKWNNETGYGLVDAYEAVKIAQQMNSSTLDLYIKDSFDDFGIEPNTSTSYMWTTNDIWIRNQDDDGLEHQNPEYGSNNTPNYIYVRVINKSSVPSTGNEKLKLYWAKASTGLSYPNPWTGGIYHPTTGAEMGEAIGIFDIPVLQPGQETIIKKPWMVPNPADYGTDAEQWHFCLLSRIESTDDPMTVVETTDLNANVRKNNNIAWKNISVVDLLASAHSGTVAVSNPSDVAKNYDLELLVDDMEIGEPVYVEAEVSIKMDTTLYNAWQRGGAASQRLSSTLEERKKLVNGIM